LQEVSPSEKGISADTGHALVVEDNPVNRTLIAAILKSLDFDVTFAANGEQAVDVVGTDQFDLILMDIQMPVMDGFEATRAIRALGGWRSSVPIIAVTANEMARDRSTYLAAGLDDLIVKPINARLFAKTVLGHLSRRAE
jgi:CheY-like chemotaxis protein